MTSRLDISAPATLTVLAGSGTLSSLLTLPPGGITVSDPNTTGTLTVQIAAGNAAAALSASGGGGATVSGSGPTLTLSGTAAQVNAALASLEVIEPATASQDLLTISASDPAALAAQTEVFISVPPLTGPAFVAPPLLVTLQPNALDALPGLLLSDPAANALTAVGQGRSETLSLTLAVASGVLLLPGYSATSAVAASGLGTGTIALNFTADEIGALNTLLAGLQFAGPAGGQHLDYTLVNQRSVLTYGNIFLNVAGTAGGNGSIVSGGQTIVLGGETLSGGLNVSGTMTLLGDSSVSGLVIAPNAALELPYNALSLSGTSMDFGTLAAGSFALSGVLEAANGAVLQGPVTLGAGAGLDFSGTLQADAAETLNYQMALSLAAGAVISGNGMVLAGNFSEAGGITGPGTLLALGGETLVLAGGSVGGGAHLAVAAGGVIEVGPSDPLYGVFNATAITIDSSVTLSFLGNVGASPVSGGYADTLGGTGGAFVIAGPQDFSGTVVGFAPGDQLIFSGLSSASILNVTTGSFTIGGQDSSGSTVSYIIHAALPSGSTLFLGTDAQGDPSAMLRPAAATVVAAAGVFGASAGAAQPLPGLSLELASSTTQSLSLTLSTGHGSLSEGTLGPAATLTLNAGGIAAMNADLAALEYTGTGVGDTLTIASSTGMLAGLQDYIFITADSAGTVSGYGGAFFSAAQIASFGVNGSLTPFTMAIAPGEMLVTGMVEFAGVAQVNGISGTALRVDAGGEAVFNAAASVALGGDVTLGDAGGAGTLAILTQAFSSSGNMTLAGASAAAGSEAMVLGSLGLGGALDIGGSAAAGLELGGSLSAGSLTLGSAGSLLAYGGAVASLGNVADAGNVTLAGNIQARASALQLTGGLTLGGTAYLDVAGAVQIATAQGVQIGQDTTLAASGITQTAGGIGDAGTIISAGSWVEGGTVSLSGGVLDALALTLQAGATLAGYGVVNAASIADAGLIEALGGTLVLGGSVTGTAGLEIAGTAALEIAGSIGAAPVTFAGAAALLTVNDPANFSTSIGNMVASDAIDLVGVAPSRVSYAAGTLTVRDTLGTILALDTLSTAAGQPAVSLVSDGAGGTLVTLGGELPCFARGTRLLTPHGYQSVESLKPGDPLITASGARRPVRWIGRRTLDLHAGRLRAGCPVLITPDAFGPGLPGRPLRLSPLHCVYVDGVLIPATHLVNGATILREVLAPAMTYYHIELDRHDILLAEGLPCESYFDSGNRGALYQEVGRRSPAPRPFAPSVTGGARLAKVRRRLHDIALARGFVLTYWPKLRAIAAGQSVVPEMVLEGGQRLARFEFAAPVRDVTLLAATACPAETDPACEDWRELGVCLKPRQKLLLGAGFYPRAAADAGVWMGKTAALRLAGAQREVTLVLAAVAQSWTRPVVDARAGAG